MLSAGHFIVTGPDIEPLEFKSRREAKTGAGRDIPARLSTRSARMRRAGCSSTKGVAQDAKGGVTVKLASLTTSTCRVTIPSPNPAPGAFSLRRNKERAVKVGWVTWTFFKDETDEST